MCSTYSDLIPYRKAIFSLLERMKLGIIGMEVFGARSAEPIQTCIKEVKKSSIFIAIIGMRYGSIDPQSAKSFIQMEYEAAIESNLDILIYLIDTDNALIPPKFVDKGENANKLDIFKEYLRNHHTIEFFTDINDLTAKIERDIVRVLKEKGIEINEEELESLSDKDAIIETVKQFGLMPKLLNGKEIELIVEFQRETGSIKKELCQAFDLTNGASVWRSIKIIDPNDSQTKKYGFMREIYGENEQAMFLYNAEIGKPYKIIAKLSYGLEQVIIIHNPSIRWSFYETSPIVDLETGREIKNYINYIPRMALILVKEA